MNLINKLLLSFLLSLACQAQASSIYSAAVLADDPMAYWRFGETSGSTAFDRSGNGHHATYNNGPSLGETGAIAGDSNTAVRFDGVDDNAFVNNPAPFQFVNESVTLEAWVQVPDNANVYYEYFFLGNTSGTYLELGKSRSGANNGEFFFQTDRGGIRSSVRSGGDPAWTGPDMIKNEWIHLVGVLDINESLMSMYINGDLISTSALHGIDIATSGFDVILGASKNGSCCHSSQKGPMDEFAIYNYALSAEQISNHFQLANSTSTTSSVPAPESFFLVLIGLWASRRFTHNQ